MRESMKRALAAFVAVLIAVALSGCGEPERQEPDAGNGNGAGIEAPESDDGEGAQLVNGKCSRCHNLDRVENAKKSRPEWDTTVDRMISNGLQVTAGEKAAIVDYLAERDEAR